MEVTIVEADVLILGGGAAALRAAIEAAAEGCRTAIVSKGPIGKSGASTMAAGGMNVALGIGDRRDTPQVHFQDTIAAGRGLADPELVRILCDEAPDRLRDLREYGVAFQVKDGALAQIALPGHTYPRLVSSPTGGVGYMVPLRRVARQDPRVYCYEDVMALRLLRDDERVVGAAAYDVKQGGILAFLAPATVIATGGYQDIYPTSDAGPDATGDGYALACAAGADLVDMEMLLYYPTALVSPPSAKGILISYEIFLNREGIGAHLVDAAGEDVLGEDEPLPTRDVMSRRIFDTVQAGRGTARGALYIDFGRSSLPAAEQEAFFRHRTPNPFSLLSALGFDMVNSRLEVAPAAHYVLGGIKINARCETSLPGLFAAGEVAGNVHGANRLAGNALTETQVFGQRAGYFAAQLAHSAPQGRIPSEQLRHSVASLAGLTEPKTEPDTPGAIKNAIRRVMLDHVGPTRSESQLQAGLQQLRRIVQDRLPRMQVALEPSAFNYTIVEALEARFMASVGMLVCQAATMRKESRGHHFRTDFPTTSDVVPALHTVVNRRSHPCFPAEVSR